MKEILHVRLPVDILKDLAELEQQTKYRKAQLVESALREYVKSFREQLRSIYEVQK